MNSKDVLLDGYERIHQAAKAAVDGLTTGQLERRLDSDANPISWLIWHLARVQDDHIAGVANTEQRWTAKAWSKKFNLPFDDDAIGYGQSSAEVAQVKEIPADLLAAYLDDVNEATKSYLDTLGNEDLDMVIDANWNPPVTLGVRLVSVIADGLQHAGQAAYARGIIERS